MFGVVTATVIGATGKSRRSACVLVTLALLIAGLPSAPGYSGIHYTIAGANILDTVDHFAGTIAVIITGILTAVAFSWYVDRQTIESGIGSKNRLIRVIVPICRHVIPRSLSLSFS